MRGDLDTVRYEEIVLDRLKVSAQACITGHALASAEVHTHMDYMRDALMFQLSTEVLAERLLDTEVTVPWSGSADVWVNGTEPSGLGWLCVLACALMLATPVFGVGIFLVGWVLALFTLGLLALNPSTEGHFDEAIVGGSIGVPATYWRKWPEMETVYPKNFGRPVLYAQVGSPYWEQS